MEATLSPPPAHTDPAEDRASGWWGSTPPPSHPDPPRAGHPAAGVCFLPAPPGGRFALHLGLRTLRCVLQNTRAATWVDQGVCDGESVTQEISRGGTGRATGMAALGGPQGGPLRAGGKADPSCEP